MSFYSRAEGIILKYIHFLSEKDVVKDYKIEKSLARTLYMEEFKPQHKISKFSFSTMFRVMLQFRLIEYKSKRTDIIHFKSDLFSYAIRYYTDDLKTEPSISSLFRKKRNKSKALKCNLCNVAFSRQNLMEEHEASEQHLERVKFAGESAAQDQSAIIVEIEDGHGGDPENVIVRQNEQDNVLIKILNKSLNTYTIETIKAGTTSDSITLRKPSLPCTLSTNSKQNLDLIVNFNDCLFFTYPLLLTFKNAATQEVVEVVKTIMFHIHSDLVDDLHVSQAYNKFVKPDVRDTDYEIVPGISVPPTTHFTPKFKLAPYLLPQYVRILSDHNFTEFPDMSPTEKTMLSRILKDFASFSKSGNLDLKNYFNISQLRLYMEEYQMKIDIRMYDVDHQTLSAAPSFRNNFFELSVPGLAEHRPSLLRGDSVFVQDNKDSKIKYEGIVNKVNQSSVILGFSHKFADTVHVTNKKYLASFGFNRVPLRAEHQAIELTRKHGIIPLLCPNELCTSPLGSFSFVWRNLDIKNNEKQQSAVRHIVSETSRPLPYLVFGPPGTGKTVTVVEAILQIRHHKPSHNILVSAPSNFAADEIAKRLIKHGLTKLELFRYVAPSYSYDLIHTSIKPYTNFKTEFYHPPNVELLKYSVVITTLVTASRLVNGGTPPGHFSYVFIDESGHATESETLIPIAGILSCAEKPGVINGQIVLAGDPEQLGPIIHSHRAKCFGYGMSMLERFMTKCDIYKKTNDGYNDKVLTKLVNSYRSHPAILKLPNDLFYDGELIPPEDRELTDIAVGWEELPNTNFPVVFHSVFGKDEREANSPSFFNLQEIDVVAVYLQKLIGSRLRGMKIEEEHIGVITPYRKQVHKLQAVCKKKQWNKLTVGSVEQFQGQERLIIIMSTVRSRPEYTTHDEKYHLGFLKNPKRFNVAITRAKALLIVVGNPNILQHDECWRKFIQYCLNNDSIRGTLFSILPPVNVVTNGETNGTTNGEANDETNGEELAENANFSRGNV